MYKQAWQTIKNANSILLVSHVHPDGDTLGGALALYSVLKDMGKDVNLYNFSEVMPRRLDFLPNIKHVSNQLPILYFDVVVTCDCASLDRTHLKKGSFTLINIDHHITNESFGDLNIIDAQAPSATMVVYELLEKNSVALTKEAALCLYVGFVEDTGFFTYGNLTPKSLEAVGKLASVGVDLTWVGTKMRQTTPLSLLRLKQHVYDVFYLIQNATIGVVIITQKDLKRIGCEEDDTKNIINPIRELATVEMAIMILEKKFGGAKVSLRSKKSIDTSAIALAFGGGGHTRASGFEVELFEPEKIIQKIVDIIDLK